MKLALFVASSLATQVACIWTQGETTRSVSVGMLTWNTADMKLKSFLTEETQSVMTAAFNAAKIKNNPPDLYAIAFQETKTPYCSGITPDNAIFIDKMNPDKTQYKFVKQSWRDPSIGLNVWTGCKTTHGSSGVILFAKNDLSIEDAGRFRSDLKSNNEKGFSAVWIKLNGKMICWGTSHSPPGKKLNDPDRYLAFEKYAGFFDNFEGKWKDNEPKQKSCDVKFYAGDFNWRNGEWNDDSNWESPHFDDAEVKEFFKTLKLGFHDSVEKPLKIPKILDTANEKTKMVVKARGKKDAWFEGTSSYFSMQNAVSPRTYPTFQPISTKKCPNVDKNIHGPPTEAGEISPDEPSRYEEADDAALYAKDTTNTIAAFADQTRSNTTELIMPALPGSFALQHEGKSEICLKIDEIFGCWGPQICFTGNRPLAYADAIFHQKSRAEKYGTLLIPVPSDHFPVVGAYIM